MVRPFLVTVSSSMRRRLLDMISPHSLSAFSASIANGGISAAGHVQKARSQQAPAQATAPAPQSTGSAAPGTSRQPGQMMPRGSLLDLTV
jgi:hypothetical protein